MTIRDFEQLKHESDCAKTTMPSWAVPKDKFTDRTANGLTKLIVTFLNHQGAQAERINTTGRYLQGDTYTDVLGHKRVMKGKYIPGSGTSGSADISAVISGRAVKIEVKMKDKQSEAQRKYQADIERAGGLYWLVHNWEEFFSLYSKL